MGKVRLRGAEAEGLVHEGEAMGIGDGEHRPAAVAKHQRCQWWARQGGQAEARGEHGGEAARYERTAYELHPAVPVGCGRHVHDGPSPRIPHGTPVLKASLGKL